MKIIKPTDFKHRAEKGELYLRVDFNVVALSSQVVEDMKLKAGDYISFGEDKNSVFMFKPKNKEDVFKLRSSGKSGLCFSIKPFSVWILQKYGLYDILKNSDEFRCHKFPLEITDDDGIYLIVPPQKYTAPKPKAVLEKA